MLPSHEVGDPGQISVPSDSQLARKTNFTLHQGKQGHSSGISTPPALSARQQDINPSLTFQWKKKTEVIFSKHLWSFLTPSQKSFPQLFWQ